MRNTVLASLETQDGSQCVDFFMRQDGTFGFEQYRVDHDGAAQWQSLDRYAHLSFGSGQEALLAAKAHIPWLSPTQRWRW